MTVRSGLIVAALFLFALSAAWGRSSDPDFRIRGVSVGMDEKQVQEMLGPLDREKRPEFDELNSEQFEVYIPHRDKDTMVAFDKDSRKVVFVMGTELTRDGRLMFLAGEDQYRVPLVLMPMQHDDNWIFRFDRSNLAIQFSIDAAKTGPIIARMILEEPAVRIKGGWVGGLDPRPGPKNNGAVIR